MDSLQVGCDFIIHDPDFKPRDGKTFCNIAVQLVAADLGCNELNGLLADGICEVMNENKSGKWNKVSGSDATIWALSGKLSIASMSSARLSEDHGHVAVIYPLGMQHSGSLGHDVPLVANVGKTVGLMRSSQAFPVYAGEADYFTWG